MFQSREFVATFVGATQGPVQGLFKF